MDFVCWANWRRSHKNDLRAHIKTPGLWRAFLSTPLLSAPLRSSPLCSMSCICIIVATQRVHTLPFLTEIRRIRKWQIQTQSQPFWLWVQPSPSPQHLQGLSLTSQESLSSRCEAWCWLLIRFHGKEATRLCSHGICFCPCEAFTRYALQIDRS